MGFHHRKLFVSVDRLLEQNLHEESQPFCINCLQMLLWIMFSFLGMAMGFVQSYWPTTGFFLFCFCLFPFIYFYMIIVTKVVVKTFSLFFIWLVWPFDRALIGAWSGAVHYQRMPLLHDDDGSNEHRNSHQRVNLWVAFCHHLHTICVDPLANGMFPRTNSFRPRARSTLIHWMNQR